MKRFLAALAWAISLSLLLFACSGGGGGKQSEKLNGKWTADAEESIKLSGQTLENELELQMAKAILAAVNLNIDLKAQKMSFNVGDAINEEMTFTIASEDKKSVVLQSEDEKKVTFEFINDDFVIMRDESDPDKAIALKRAAQ